MTLRPSGARAQTRNGLAELRRHLETVPLIAHQRRRGVEAAVGHVRERFQAVFIAVGRQAKGLRGPCIKRGEGWPRPRKLQARDTGSRRLATLTTRGPVTVADEHDAHRQMAR